MICFFDTETTGLPDYNKRARDPAQPHVVQFSAILMASDGREMEMHNLLSRPDGWLIPDEASAVHGITNEVAMAYGIAEDLVARVCLELFRKASLIVAHNVTFDKFLMRIAMRRYDLIQDSDDAWWKGLNTFCTMRTMTPICNLPGQYGAKWPKLQEAHKHCFGAEFEGAHDALADVRACARIYQWIQDRKAGKAVAHV